MEQDFIDKMYLRWVIAYQDQIDFDSFLEQMKPVPISSEKDTMDKVFDIIERTNKHGNI